MVSKGTALMIIRVMRMLKKIVDSNNHDREKGTW